MISQDASDTLCGEAHRDIMLERSDQIDRHGYTAGHDADHDPGELAVAGLAYATMGVNLLSELGAPTGTISPQLMQEAQQYWPWMDGFRPSVHARPNLVKAAALIWAAIDRIDAAAIDPAGEPAFDFSNHAQGETA